MYILYIYIYIVCFLVWGNLKITKQRRAVLNAFIECENHVSAEELYNLVVENHNLSFLKNVTSCFKGIKHFERSSEVDNL